MESVANIFVGSLAFGIILGVITIISYIGLIAWSCGQIAESLGRDKFIWIMWGLMFNLFALILIRFFLPPVGVKRKRI